MALPITLNPPPSRATAPDDFVVDMDYWWANDLPGLVAAINALNANDWFNVLGAVSQLGGVPTGSLFEYDSNANGDYVRFADGTQICWFNGTSSASAQVTWTYPAVFSSTPSVHATVSAGSARVVFIGSRGASSVGFNVYDLAATRSENPVDLMAVGRWFEGG